METTTRIRTEYWPQIGVDELAENGQSADLEVERSEGEPGRIAIHTYVDGRGSLTSYYLDREAAIVLARNVLTAVALD